MSSQHSHQVSFYDTETSQRITVTGECSAMNVLFDLLKHNPRVEECSYSRNENYKPGGLRVEEKLTRKQQELWDRIIAAGGHLHIPAPIQWPLAEVGRNLYRKRPDRFTYSYCGDMYFGIDLPKGANPREYRPS